MDAPSCYFVDLDDTLYPELSYVESGYGAIAPIIAERAGLEAGAVLARLRYELRKFGRTGAFDRLYARYGLEAPPIEELVEAYRAHAPAIAFYPGAAEALERLRARAPVVLVTDGAAIMQERKVAALDLSDRVDAIVLCDALGAPKPDPRGYEHGAKLVGAAARDGLVIGDDPYHDIAAARALGARSARVRTGRFADLDAPHYEPDIEAETFAALAARLAP